MSDLTPVYKNRLESLDRFTRRYDRWVAAVEDHRLNGAPYPNVRRMPSDKAKGHAYDDAYALREGLGLDVPRASTVDDLKATSTAAHAALLRQVQREKGTPAAQAAFLDTVAGMLR